MNANEKRIALIKQVFKADNDFRALINELSGYDWDFNGTPALLEKKTIRDILVRFLAGDISRELVYEWAEFMELREDIDYPEEDEFLLSEIIHDLANPNTEGELTVDNAKRLMAKL